eukprot:TRINITY_DN7001_c0_g1_i2.p1 TRINITY_DN7001_c0_g1~~TRINITY_DN7001_c0_g1_i2.p1  ORF type:complete len:403 (-),score=46.79 TRINITY_DN7001_c0_g1_i2:121-1329(-)
MISSLLALSLRTESVTFVHKARFPCLPSSRTVSNAVGGLVKHAAEQKSNDGVVFYSDGSQEDDYFCRLAGSWPVEVKKVEGKGRGMFATKPISKGEAVFFEEPFISLDYSAKSNEYCHNCYKPFRDIDYIERGQPFISKKEFEKIAPAEFLDNMRKGYKMTPIQKTRCPECETTYCSDRCLRKAREIYHQIECLPHFRGLKEELQKSLAFHPFLLRIASALYQQQIYPPTNPGLLVQEKLNHLCFKPTEKPWSKEYLDALVSIQKLLPPDTSVATLENLDRVHSTISLNSITITTSTLGITAINKSGEMFVKATTDEQNAVVRAVGVFALASYMNHSCDANVVIKLGNHGSYLGFTADRDLKRGDELFCNYVSSSDTREERRKRLFEHYQFLCECPKCLRGD